MLEIKFKRKKYFDLIFITVAVFPSSVNWLYSVFSEGYFLVSRLSFFSNPGRVFIL